MKGLDTKGIRELDQVRKRVRRMYGLGRISRNKHDELMVDIDGLRDKLVVAEREKNDEKEATA